MRSGRLPTRSQKYRVPEIETIRRMKLSVRTLAQVSKRNHDLRDDSDQERVFKTSYLEEVLDGRQSLAIGVR